MDLFDTTFSVYLIIALMIPIALGIWIANVLVRAVGKSTKKTIRVLRK